MWDGMMKKLMILVMVLFAGCVRNIDCSSVKEVTCLNKKGEFAKTGTAFPIARDGYNYYFMTCDHVTVEGCKYYINNHRGENVYSNNLIDVHVFKVFLPKELHVFKFGEPHIMDRVVVVGFPLDGKKFIHSGRISYLDSLRFGTNAGSSPGFSGGPVINIRGEVVGMLSGVKQNRFPLGISDSVGLGTSSSLLKKIYAFVILSKGRVTIEVSQKKYGRMKYLDKFNRKRITRPAFLKGFLRLHRPDLPQRHLLQFPHLPH